MTAAWIVRGDARQLPLADKSVQCVVTSPPYFGLRSYGGQVSVWGAWRGELGSEPTPALFVTHLVEVLAEVKRVLRDDGVVFLNIGDSYSGSGRGPTGSNGIQAAEKRQGFGTGYLRANGEMSKGGRKSKTEGTAGIPAKSLLLVPERLAIALSDDGWIIRSRIAWCKAAPMPESVRDRPTSAWEHIWMLSKSGRYYWDATASREESVDTWNSAKQFPSNGRNAEVEAANFGSGTRGINTHHDNTEKSGRNPRNYWVLNPDPYPGAHFATFPREIPRRCILAASREGDVVLDPFSGSATTAYVAGSLGRRGVGVELSAEYVQQARYGRLAQDFLPLETA